MRIETNSSKEHQRLVQEHEAAKQAWLRCILPDFSEEKKRLWRNVKDTEKALERETLKG